MSEEALKARINDLENELQQKNGDINSYLDKIDELETNVMKLEGLIKEAEKEGSFDPTKVQETKLSIELEQKERELRKLKNKMGYLRKEKIKLQKQLEEQEFKPNKESTVIRIKEKPATGPFEGLVKELQSKIHKQQILIDQLKEERSGGQAPLEEFEDKLKGKNKKIQELESQIGQLKEELQSDSTSDTISKSLTEELQDKLNRTRRRVRFLQDRLSNYEEVEDVLGLKITEEETDNLQKQIQKLKEELGQKTNTIKELRETISCLEGAQSDYGSTETSIESGGMISELTEELQKKLNKAKIHIKELESQLEKKSEQTSDTSINNDQIPEIVAQKDKTINNLKSTIESQENLIKNKQEELETIKNEAMKCNSEIERLKKELHLKENQIKELKDQINSLQQKSEHKESKKATDISLRVNELKNMVKELKKENAQQLIEISELRK